MTLDEYRKSIKALQIFMFAVPVASSVFSGKSPIPFPPLGDDSFTWRFIALLIVGSAALLPYFLVPKRGGRRTMCGLFVMLVGSSGIYLHFNSENVLAIPLPEGKFVYITRGSERNPEFAYAFQSLDDVEAVNTAGLKDAELEHVFTAKSLRQSRYKLFSSYVAMLVILELLLGTLSKAGHGRLLAGSAEDPEQDASVAKQRLE